MVTATTIALQAEPRSILGKKVKTLRRKGWTPVHMYGPDIESQSLQVETEHLHKVLTQSGRSRPIALNIKTNPDQAIVFVKDIQFHPLTSLPIHVDLIKVNVLENTQINVPLSIIGEAPAVRDLGGRINLEIETVLVECPPLQTPESITVDVSSLKTFEDSIRVSDLKIPVGVSILTDSGQLLARVTSPTTQGTTPFGEATEYRQEEENPQS